MEVIVIFEDYINKLLDELMYVDSCFELYVHLYNLKTDERTLKSMNLAPGFFQVTMRSLLESSIITLAKLFSESDDRSIVRFINYVEQNSKSIGDANSLKELIAKHRTELDNNEEAIRYLYIWRNKSFAHYDKKYFYDSNQLSKDAPLLIIYIRELIKFGGKVVNDYQSESNGKYTSIAALN